MREDKKNFSAIGCSGNSNSWMFQRWNTARIYYLLRMSASIDCPVEGIELSLLNLVNGLTAFRENAMFLSF